MSGSCSVYGGYDALADFIRGFLKLQLIHIVLLKIKSNSSDLQRSFLSVIRVGPVLAGVVLIQK